MLNTILGIWVIRYGILAVVAQTMSQESKPLVIPPSGQWDGNGTTGLWSTFNVTIGTPPQQVRLIPGTAASTNAIWAVRPDACLEFDSSPDYATCTESRGGYFDSDLSTSWDPLGYFVLGSSKELLTESLATSCGLDNVNLQFEDEGSPTISLSAQVIAEYQTRNFWLGVLGLSPLSFNLSSTEGPTPTSYPSFLTTLRDDGHIPSLSWAYNAGAHYKAVPDYGSLVLGGYDSSRLDSETKTLSMPFAAAPDRELQVQLRTITYSDSGSATLTNSTLLDATQSISIFISSLVLDLWLPRAVCSAFEEAFDLVYNETSESYPLSASHHANLLARDPSVSFHLGSEEQGTVITLPYAAFDLNQTSYDPGNGPGYQFPLRRAERSEEYTFGRVFLQEAYLVVDYERRNLTIGQAATLTGNEELVLVPILQPGTMPEVQSNATVGGTPNQTTQADHPATQTDNASRETNVADRGRSDLRALCGIMLAATIFFR